MVAIILTFLGLWWTVGTCLPFWLDGYSPGHALSATQLYQRDYEVPYVLSIVFPPSMLMIGIAVVLMRLHPLETMKRLGEKSAVKRLQRQLPRARVVTEVTSGEISRESVKKLLP